MTSRLLLRLGVLSLLATAACQKSGEPEAGAPPSGGSPDAADAAAPAAPKVHGEEVSYAANGVTLKGYLAWDEGLAGKRPGVLVVHEWWGLNEHAREAARKLAAMGYTALAVDMYGDGKNAAHPDDAGKFSGAVMADLPGATARFDAAHQLLDAHPTVDPTRTAAIGYCFGGGVVLHMARAGKPLAGVASFHGSLGTKTPAKKGEVKTPMLVMTGEADPFVPPDAVAAFTKEMTDAGADLKLVGYPGAKHSFTNPGSTELGTKFGLPLAYDAAADAASWAELTTFLQKVFGA